MNKTNVQSGRAACIELFTKVRNPEKHNRAGYMTGFDVFRIDAQGSIAEHGDSSGLWVGKPAEAEFFQQCQG